MYNIEKNFTPPNKHKAIRETLKAMELNDSFLLPYLDRPNYFMAKAGITDRKFMSRRFGKDHVRIFRIK